MDARIEQISSNLYLIVLTPPITGFHDFIGSWVYTGSPSFVADVGPAVTAGDLLQSLNELGVRDLDYILMTHIHMDHVGAIGHIAAHFSDTPVVCHQSAIEHLIDPSRLWAGTLKTLGDTGKAYGQIKAVPADQLRDAAEFDSAAIRPIITPGHASHHVSYLTDEFLVAGEAGGVHYRLPGSHEYLRPATPPRFFLDTSVRSIDALLEARPTRICYGHFGSAVDAVGKLQSHRDQLLRWETIVGDIVEQHDDGDIVEKSLEAVLQQDYLLSNIARMEESVQEREKFFLRNSIRGFLGHLKSRSKDC